MTSSIAFHEAKIERLVRETPHSQHLEIRLPSPEIAATYSVPGQYAIIRVPGHKDGYFAFTQAPGSDTWSFLIKQASSLTADLLLMAEGDSLLVSSAQGRGFALQGLEGKKIFLFAVGSGIAPIRAALLHFIRERDRYGAITLYYGARNSDEFAYAREFPDWKLDKINIFLTVSNKQSQAGEQLVGYVQHHIPTETSLNDTVALVCGMKPMVEGVKEKLTSLGLAPERILTNF